MSLKVVRWSQKDVRCSGKMSDDLREMSDGLEGVFGRFGMFLDVLGCFLTS